MTLADPHTRLDLQLIQRAETHFQSGDMPKASKSAWDAIAFCLKTIAEQRGWPHETHLDLSRVVTRLAKESDAPQQMHAMFGSVDGLYANAYENWFTDTLVETGIQDAKEFLDILEKFVDAAIPDKAAGETSSYQPKIHSRGRRCGFEKGDMPEASEMAWGAVAHYLKSIAKRRGWRNRSHRDLALIAERLANESYDTYRIHTLYRSANSLHVNFYEDWLDDDTVRMRIEETKEFVGRLEKEFPE